MEFRIGLGYDSHRLEVGRRLVLAGVHVPFEMGLQGHSDADVVFHALTDALCGAAGLPDIGQLFPDTDGAWKDADSGILLAQVVAKVRASGWEIGNVDCVLVAQKPKISPYTGAMKASIARRLGVEEDRVNVRGKTGEGLDDVGAGLGMICHAVALLSKRG